MCVLFYSYICHEQKKQKMSNKLSVLSFGGGQDSTAILYKLMYDKQFRSKYAPNDIVVVMANTLNEHDATYEHIEEIGIEKARKTLFLFEITSPVHRIDQYYNEVGDYVKTDYGMNHAKNKFFKRVDFVTLFFYIIVVVKK